ncbi:CUB and zona pellucida-like domain-containing protein 1 [Branchiostoma lanceolatum]|uniref:CUB and zona pellucida-like domain-containing protein 1 n=1 Tax=Branchiostoma lanceolatum TaxID=7740 RepID=UPI003455862F
MKLYTSDIGVKVTCTSHLLLVSFLRTSRNGFSFQKTDVHFAAPPCSADENSTHINIQAPLTDCGTRKRQVTRFTATYSNTLTINLNASSAIKIDVECYLPRLKVVTVNFNQQSVYKSRVVGRGEFIVSMELYMSDSFRSPVSEYPLYVEFGQMLYAQLQVTSDDTNLYVFAEHCWVTPTELNYGPYDSEEDYIIRGGCVRHSTVRYDSPSTMEDRFGFRAFPPTRTTRKIYLQCEVLLCDVTNSSSRCAKGCIEDMYRWKRETEGDTEVYQLIRGPIVLVELNSNQTDREDVSRSHTGSMLSSFMGACAVMVVVAMLIVI